MVGVSDRPPYATKHGKEYAQREYQSVLGLVNPSVALRHPDDPPVDEWTSHDHGRNDSDDVPDAYQALES